VVFPRTDDFFGRVNVMVMGWDELECYFFFAHESFVACWAFVIEELNCRAEAAVDKVLVERGVCFS